MKVSYKFWMDYSLESMQSMLPLLLLNASLILVHCELTTFHYNQWSSLNYTMNLLFTSRLHSWDDSRECKTPALSRWVNFENSNVSDWPLRWINQQICLRLATLLNAAKTHWIVCQIFNCLCFCLRLFSAIYYLCTTRPGLTWDSMTNDMPPHMAIMSPMLVAMVIHLWTL